MTRIDVVSGFLGAGKTTLIGKLLEEALKGTKVVLIENEFGQVGIDGGFLKESGVEMREMSQGCICCSLVGDFDASLREVLDTFSPERIIIEPSGVGKLSDVIRAIQGVEETGDVTLSSAVTVVDAKKCRSYAKNFGEFFLNQIEHAGLILLSRTSDLSDEKITEVMELIREHNKKAPIITTPWDDLKGQQILEAMEKPSEWMEELLEDIKNREWHDHHHHHDHEDHGHHHHEEHEHHHHDHEDHGHHHHDEHEHEHRHDHDHHHEEHDHHHDHHHEEHDHHHDHHHEHDHHHHHPADCDCGCHDHHHHHHHDHDADEIFDSWGKETPASYRREDIKKALDAFDAGEEYGQIIRAKGILPDAEGGWMFFDYVPGEADIRDGEPDLTGRICVIGAELKEDKLAELFG